jgi:cytochrome P450
VESGARAPAVTLVPLLAVPERPGNELNSVSPTPPRAAITFPWDDADAPDPVAALGSARLDLGDTFAVRSGDDEYLFVFSPPALRNFYSIPEAVASKGLADFAMLTRTLPAELFLERRTMPHDLFGAQDVESYLDALDHAIASSLDELGADGEIDLFDWSRRMGHRLALATWIGRNATTEPVFGALVDCMDTLDGAAAFVTPAAAAAPRDYRKELEALDRMEALVTELTPGADGFLPQISARWSDTDSAAARRGVARDVVVLHIGTMTNLFAALAWTLAMVALHSEPVDDPARLERCALEAIRLGQHSLISRSVLRECTIDDGETTWTLAPGTLLATMAPLTNRTAAPGLAEYDPDRWDRRRVRDPIAAPEQIVTFGHGAHRCPAMRFSLSAITRATRAFFERFEVRPRFEAVHHRPGQIGGVARAGHPCIVTYFPRTA